MSPTYELIDSITLSSDQSSVSFNNISQTYDDLMIVISARNADATVTREAGIQINNDTATTYYSMRYLDGNGASATSGTLTRGYIYAGQYPAATATSNTFSNIQVSIPNYTSNSNKSVSVSATMENNSATSYIDRVSGLWSQTAAISSLTVVSNAGDLVTGSTFELYGIKNADDGSEGYFGPAARGGDEVYTTGDGYKVHVFKTSGTLEVTSPGEVEYLVVAGGGGGGGGNSSDGGGGAGGFRSGFIYSNSGVYNILVGAGGSGANGAQTSGGNSTFLSIVSNGGGYGGSGTIQNGANGGSGGGAYFFGVGGIGNTPATIPSQGNNGGGPGVGSPYPAGGGGGAGAVGNSGSGSISGSGGVGAYSSISGVSSAYAGGGGGGGNSLYTSLSPGAGGVGGGGAGGNEAAGTSGTANTGGGGGGGGPGGNGGSGIVIIRYKV